MNRRHIILSALCLVAPKGGASSKPSLVIANDGLSESEARSLDLILEDLRAIERKHGIFFDDCIFSHFAAGRSYIAGGPMVRRIARTAETGGIYRETRKLLRSKGVQDAYRIHPNWRSW